MLFIGLAEEPLPASNNACNIEFTVGISDDPPAQLIRIEAAQGRRQRHRNHWPWRTNNCLLRLPTPYGLFVTERRHIRAVHKKTPPYSTKRGSGALSPLHPPVRAAPQARLRVPSPRAHAARMASSSLPPLQAAATRPHSSASAAGLSRLPNTSSTKLVVSFHRNTGSA